jgi:hypothetical protein
MLASETPELNEEHPYLPTLSALPQCCDARHNDGARRTRG